MHDNWPMSKCNCQKQNRFTPRQYHFERAGFKNKLAKNFKDTQKARNSFVKPSLTIAGPYTGMAVSAKTRNPKIGGARSKN